MASLPCFLCICKLEQRISKRGKPYFVCDSCGMQIFIRRKQGIERLQELFKNIERAQIPFQQHAHNFNEMQAILHEIDGVKQKIREIGFFFLDEEEIRSRNLLKTRLETLFQKLEELAQKKN